METLGRAAGEALLFFEAESVLDIVDLLETRFQLNLNARENVSLAMLDIKQ
jgi:hypothetical protein